MTDLTLQLAARHPYAHDRVEAARNASLEWVAAQRNNIGDPYGPRMGTRMRMWFERGVMGQSSPVANSNYDRPLEAAYRAGRMLWSALSQLHAGNVR